MTSELTKEDLDWKQYRRTNIAEMRPYVPGEDMAGVSVSDADDPPNDHGMVARNPQNHADQWYVARRYFEENFEPLARAHLEARESGWGLEGITKTESNNSGLSDKYGLKGIGRFDGNTTDLIAELVSRGDTTSSRAADALAAMKAENERLREALKTAESWLERWAQHVGRCRGGAQCECGLEAVRYDARTALRKDTE